MATSREYVDYVLELLQPVLSVQTTRFFGGVGLLHGATQFAMIIGNSLYFVVDDSTRPKYQAAGMKSFSYVNRKGRIQVRRYFELPEDVLTDPRQLQLWARESIAIAAKDKNPRSKKAAARTGNPKLKKRRRSN